MMHRLLPLLVLLGLLLAPVPAVAQDTPFGFFPHVTVRTVRLDAGNATTLPLAFEGGAFAADWALVINAEVDGGPVDVTLTQEDATVETWTLAATDGTQHLHGALAREARANLTFEAGGRPSNVTFYYDMSCDCAGKTIPVAIEDGRVVFRVHVQEGATWRATIPEPPAHRLAVDLTERTDPASRYPDDFRTLFESREPIRTGGRAYHTFEWTAEATKDHYFWLQSVETNASAVGNTDGPATLVAPGFREVQAAPDGPSTPLPGWLAAAALVAGLLMLRKRRS